MTTNTKERTSLVNKFLNGVEKAGNKLPDPAMLFFLMCVGLAVITWIVSLFDVSVKHPGNGETIHIKSILSTEGIAMIMNDAVKNFSEFPALGLVLAVMIGVGAAEKSGYFDKLMISVVNRASNQIIVPTIILVYAFTEPATKIVSDSVKINVAMNWYFIAASVILVLPVIYFTTTKVVIPRLGEYDASQANYDEEEETSSHITPTEKKALFWANMSFLLLIVALIICCIPEGSWLRNAKTGSLIDDSPLINGVGLVILVIFLIPGMVYGILSKQIKNSKDLGSMISDSLGSMGSFILIVFFAAQLLAFLQWSNLGIIVSVYGAKLLQHQNGIVLIIGIIILSGLINLIIGSASAKWGILAPIFVPMMILLGYHPAFTQMIYRVGDSITNPITPMMPYMPLVLSYAQKYDKNMKLGSLLSSLMPYTFALGVVWTLFVIAWYLLGIPLGPGGPVKIPK